MVENIQIWTGYLFLLNPPATTSAVAAETLEIHTMTEVCPVGRYCQKSQTIRYEVEQIHFSLPNRWDENAVTSFDRVIRIMIKNNITAVI